MGRERGVVAHQWRRARRLRLLRCHSEDRRSVGKTGLLTASRPTTVLYPRSGGNRHCLTAVTYCAVLDVLVPPYSEEVGRFCTYYHDYPYSAFTSKIRYVENENEDEYAWLKAIDAPDDLYMRSGRDSGPAIQEELCFPGSCTIA